MNLFSGNVYYYRKSGNEILGALFCRSIKKRKYYIIPLEDISSGHYVSLSTLNKYAIISELTEVRSSKIRRPLYIKGKPCQLNKTDYLNCYNEFIKGKLLIENANISSTVPNTTVISDLGKFFEESIKFLNWQSEKFDLSFKTSQNLTVYQNGVYWANLGYNIGTEINKQRPVIIWKKIINRSDSKYNSYVIIPLTSKDKGKNYYYNVPIIIDGLTFYAKVNDLRRIHQNRIKRPRNDHHNSIHFITQDERDDINDAIERYYIF